MVIDGCSHAMSWSVPLVLCLPIFSFAFRPRLVTKVGTSFSVLHHIIWSPGLAFLRAADATEADALRVLVVQDFDGVAVRTETTGPVKSDKARDGVHKRNERNRRAPRAGNSLTIPLEPIAIRTRGKHD